ncbi:MAG: glycine cleavage T C-terminal barrel domain-containing protein [Euryarchaeota archaeon]|nr:glycine cleavage T C-terminal barrel domain-containing protein [Euryarchaeota archaeon]
MTEKVKPTTLGKAYKHSVKRWQNFYGYKMPVAFSTPANEVLEALRNVVMFDISDMLYVVVTGKNVLKFTHKLQIRNFKDINKISSQKSSGRKMCGKSKYTFFMKNGFVKEDGMLGFYDGKLIITTNVCLRNEMLNTYNQLADEIEGVEIANCTDSISAISVQGRNLEKILTKLFDMELDSFAFTDTKIRGIKNNPIKGNVNGEIRTVFGKPLVFKLSYGLNGVEIVTDKRDGPRLWNHLLQLGVKPSAQVARDLLRMIKGYPLSDKDFGLNEKKTPYELGYGHLVENTECLGYKNPKRREIYKRICFVIGGGTGPLPRRGYKFYDKKGNELGYVTSGGITPLPDHEKESLPIRKKRIGIGYVKEGYESYGNKLYVDIRGKKYETEIKKPPLIKDKDLKKLNV